MNTLFSTIQSSSALRIAKRWWWLPLAFGLLSAIVAFVGGRHFLRSQYMASIVVQVSSGRGTSGGGGGGQSASSGQDANSVSMLMTTQPVFRSTMHALPPRARNLKVLLGTVCTADPITDRFVTCTTTSPNARLATVTLNTLAKTFLDVNERRQQSLYGPQLTAVAQQKAQLITENRNLQQELDAAAARMQATNSQQPTKGGGKGADLVDQYKINNLQGQISSDQANLSQLQLSEISLTGKNLQRVQTQVARLQSEISDLQSQLNDAAQRLQAAQTAKTGVNKDLVDQYKISTLQTQITQNQSALNQLNTQASSIHQQLSQATTMSVVSPAVARYETAQSSRLLVLGLGFIIGMAIGIALIILMEFMDDRFRDPEEVSAALGLTVLGVVSRFKGNPKDLVLIVARNPLSPITEAYRLVVANILLTGNRRERGVLLVTSSREGEGKTTSAANLAAQLALSGNNVLLVDGDLRRSSLSQTFQLSDDGGLSTIQHGAAIVPVSSDVPNLDIVSSGPPVGDPAALLGSRPMAEFISAMRQRYDWIIVDTPPILSVADTRLLMPLSDGVVLVIDAALSSRHLVRQTRLALEAAGTSILGVIINKSPFAGPAYYHSGAGRQVTGTGAISAPRPSGE